MSPWQKNSLWLFNIAFETTAEYLYIYIYIIYLFIYREKHNKYDDLAIENGDLVISILNL